VIVGKGLKPLIQLQVDGGVINATCDHPFWSVTNQKFQWAQDLKVGEQVLLADGRAPPIESIYSYDETTTVYNVSIQDIHTFCVGQGSVLVHNSCYNSCSEFKSANRPAGAEEQWHRIVEQSQVGRSGFSARDINSDENLIALPRDVHQQVSAYYSSKPFGYTTTIRDYLNGKRFDYQYRYGVDIMARALRGELWP
jgi:hypothetical protein